MLPGRSLTARAVIALALTAGFYGLALSMAGFLVWLPYASVVYLRLNALTGKREGEAERYDTHPSLRDRLAALEQTDPEPGPPSDPPALTLLDSVSELESMLLPTLMRDKSVALKPLAWERVGETVLMPRWTDFIKNYGHKLRGLRPSEIPVLDWAGLGKELADSAGRDGHEERLAQFTVGAALALLLVRQGFTLDAPPGEPVALVRDGLRVEPFTLRARLTDDGAERWQQLCIQAGIADVELGTVRDALRGL